MPIDRASLIPALNNIATRLRIDSIRSTSESGTGHPTSCCSMAELIAALFFAEMRFDPKDPRHTESDRFVLSKGHAAPILYAAWAEAGLFDRAELLKLRTIGSDLEGHPTPRLSFVDVATGSLGQGICAAIGTALNARRIGSDYRTYVLLGDGETAEGSVWEAADVAAMDSLDNLCGITDVNALGQSRPTMWQHDMEQFARRWRAFGWHPIVVDGHDLSAILDALAEARRTKGQPTMILARTVKGKGVSFAEGKDGWHGRAFKKGEEMDRAIAELEKQEGESGHGQGAGEGRDCAKNPRILSTRHLDRESLQVDEQPLASVIGRIKDAKTRGPDRFDRIVAVHRLVRKEAWRQGIQLVEAKHRRCRQDQRENDEESAKPRRWWRR